MSFLPVSAIKPFLYSVAYYSPLSPLVSLYEIFQKAVLSKRYSEEVGELYQHPSHRYYVEKTYGELACPLVWLIGHLALFALQAYRKGKGEALYQADKKDPQNQLKALETAAQHYRNQEAIFALGIRLKDELQNERAKTFLKVALEMGHPEAAFPLGELYLALGEVAEAAVCLQKVQTPYARLLETLAPLTANQMLLQAIQTAKPKTQNEWEQLILAFAIGNKQQSELAKALLQCCIDHFSSQEYQGKADFELFGLSLNTDHLKQGAMLGNIDAAVALSNLLRGSQDVNEQREALRLLEAIAPENRPQEASLLVGHSYLAGFGCNADFGKAQGGYREAESKGATKHTAYFVALTELLKRSSAEEQREFLVAVSELDASLRWKTTIPPYDSPADSMVVLALAVANSLDKKLVRRNAIFPQADLEHKIALVQKLFHFSSTHALPLLAQREALFRLGRLYTLQQNLEGAIKVYQACLEIGNDPAANLKLYHLFIYKSKQKGDGDYQTALTCLQAAVNEYDQGDDEKGAQVLYAYGAILVAEGQNKENFNTKEGRRLIIKAAQLGDKVAIDTCRTKRGILKPTAPILHLKLNVAFAA